jgi:hypothetical protein
LRLLNLEDSAQQSSTPSAASNPRLLPELPHPPQRLFQEVHYRDVSEQTFNRWRNQYGGMKAEEAKRLKELEGENKRLKKLLAEAELDKAILKEALEGNY